MITINDITTIFVDFQLLAEVNSVNLQTTNNMNISANEIKSFSAMII